MYADDGADDRFIVEWMTFSYHNDDTLAYHRAFTLVHATDDLNYVDTGGTVVDTLTQFRYRTW